MATTKLNPQILESLKKQTKLSEGTIRNNITKLRKKYSKSTINAVAHLYAQEKGVSIWQKLTPEDRLTIPDNEVVNSKIKIDKKPVKKQEVIIRLIVYESDNYFIKGHIEEVNKAYTKGCYTSASILARKIIENLIIDILRKKFPPTKKEDKELYYDDGKKRYLDFSVILKNLYNKRDDFGIDKSKIIDRFYQKALKFKEQANDKTHSWYHLVKNKTEIDAFEIQYLVELIKQIEN